MSEPNPLVNIGDLAKPANTLIEKISDAIGGIFKPYQIRRVAQAEAEVALLKANTEIEVTDLHKRALVRFFIEEARKQDNIESITRKAIPELAEDAQPAQIENDWIVNFFDKSRLISDEDMQLLWAKILSGEANSPGKFSKRTINLLANLDKYDAEIFTQLCGFTFLIGNEVFPLIYDEDHIIYSKYGINFSTLSHLDAIGLIHFAPLSGYIQRGLNQNGNVYYLGSNEPVWIGFPQMENNSIKIGKVILTQEGRQIAQICEYPTREGLTNYIREVWRNLGYKTEPIEQT